MMDRKLSLVISLVIGVFLSAVDGIALGQDDTETYANSIGMKMFRIKLGTFEMGSDLPRDHWDEKPIHKVRISKPFFMSETEVTIEQYRQFKEDFKGDPRFAPYVSGVSWYEAVKFCQWLSKKEGKPYSLPTEAEWEYACRAGTTSLYWSGDKPPSENQTNPWGLKNMHTGVREWCLDWFGAYPAQPQADPVGLFEGMARVVRGGPLDDGSRNEERTLFNASSNRAGMAPGFGPYNGDSEEYKIPGQHCIGFRVVQASIPDTEPIRPRKSFVTRGIKKNASIVKIGPSLNKPYFRKRYILPVPLDNSSNSEIDAVGMHPSFRKHNHSPAMEVCPNGDVLLVIYTSYDEYEPGVSLIASRLRFGADQWDMPDRLFDFAAVNDHAPLLWTDNKTVHFFWGCPKLDGGFPFQWTSSRDSGATWDEVKFPKFISMIGSHSRQPINTALRDKDGTMYIASDGSGGKSVLWVSRDNGRTWFDTEGRSAGRHTTYALLSDGKTILGMGGKNTNINGFMPQVISSDGGRTWAVSKTQFPEQGSNQRPSILMLESGRLFFAGDFQHSRGKKPDSIKQNGSYVALSDDDGKSWTIKPLIGAQLHEDPKRHNGHPTIGYSVARQAPNGMIHLITTMNRPCLHFEFNEAWILSDEKHDSVSDAKLMTSDAKSIADIKEYMETYSNGRIKARFSGGIANDGRFLLHGRETWYYTNGQRQRQAEYNLGKKTGKETYWSEDGLVQWAWEHGEDGISIWTQYWPNGQKKARSYWKNFMCHGSAELWNPSGELISSKNFMNGKIQ